MAPDIAFSDVELIANDNLVLQEKIGQGGCGIVYKGTLVDPFLLLLLYHHLSPSCLFPPPFSLLSISRLFTSSSLLLCLLEAMSMICPINN